MTLSSASMAIGVLGQPLFNSSNLSSSITELLTVLFAYINEPTVSILHHYFLKALATVIIISKQDVFHSSSLLMFVDSALFEGHP